MLSCAINNNVVAALACEWLEYLEHYFLIDFCIVPREDETGSERNRLMQAEHFPNRDGARLLSSPRRLQHLAQSLGDPAGH